MSTPTMYLEIVKCVNQVLSYLGLESRKCEARIYVLSYPSKYTVEAILPRMFSDVLGLPLAVWIFDVVRENGRDPSEVNRFKWLLRTLEFSDGTEYIVILWIAVRHPSEETISKLLQYGLKMRDLGEKKVFVGIWSVGNIRIETVLRDLEKYVKYLIDEIRSIVAQTFS